MAETSGNSKRTQTGVITKCSNGDVQVLRTIKNGASTPTGLLGEVGNVFKYSGVAENSSDSVAGV